jgi:hypothetical protein
VTSPTTRARRSAGLGGITKKPLWLIQIVGVLLLVAGALAAFGFAGRAGAGTGVGASGNVVPGATVPIGSITAGTPFDSGQQIDVVIAPNSVFTAGAHIFILECSAPSGALPTSTTQCDGNTGYSGGTITANADGSVDVTNGSSFSEVPYTVYALPDSVTLGEHSSAGAVCGVGAVNECVLYIGEGGGSDTGMSQPHFFSEPFQIHSDPTDSGTLNPGDGSAEPVTGVSPTTSTISPATQTVTGDGSDPAAVTVTLNDASSNGVPGKTVSLGAESGHATIRPQSLGTDVTNGSGQATFFVTDPNAETVTLTATDTTDGIAVTQTASVTFSPPTIDQSASTVTADPGSVPADGTTSSTITVTVKDHSVAPGSPAPMPGLSVTLAAASGSSVINPTSAVTTNASGQATFTVTDTADQTVTYKATVGSTLLTSTASVAFGTAANVSATKSTVVANPSPAFTGTSPGTTVTVTLLGADGTTPISGKSVTLSLQSNSGHATFVGPSSVTTDATGKAIFTVIDTTVETVTITATDTTDSPSVVLASKPQVAFQTPPAPTVSKTLTTLSVSPPTQIADGSSAIDLAVTVRNTLGNVDPNITVTASATPSETAVVRALNNVSNVSGVVTFEVRDTHAEAVTLTAQTASGVVFSQTATATFTPGDVNANTSTAAASPIQVPADGHTASTVTVTLTDYTHNPIAGHTVTLSPSGGSSVITPMQSQAGVTPGTSDANGVAKFAVTDAADEVVTYTATDTSVGLRVTQLAAVTFGTAPPVLPVKGDCTAVVNNQKVPADGTSTGTVTVELRDANGFPVEGKTVSLTPSGGSSTITGAKVAGSLVTPSAVGASKPTAVSAAASSSSSSTTSSTTTTSTVAPRAGAAAVTAVSNSNGNAVFTVTDKVPETVTYTAADTTDSISGWTVAVTYTAVTTTSTATSTTSASAATGGASADTTGAGDTGGSAASSPDSTGATDTSATTPTLAFTGAPAALPWIFGIGTLLLALGTIGRLVLAVRRRGQ